MRLRFLLLLSLFACAAQQQEEPPKINGLCLVAPPYEIKGEYYDPILTVNANWVAIIPYAFCSPSQPSVKFDHPNQWIGETTKGISQAVVLAKQKGLKVVLKPHIWVIGQGWAGDLHYESETDIAKWKESYTKYVLHFSRLAEKLNVEMFSIGTEVRQMARLHPGYWRELIKLVKAVYGGTITYAANWDNYKNVSFWDDLDYIGIDAYFPSSESKTPSADELINQNQQIKAELEQFSRSNLKKVLFTEFGFKSLDYCAAGHWKTLETNHSINMLAQANSYEALFKTYWNEEWFAGGFAWKWHYKHQTAGGSNHSEFSPQNKLAEKILKNQYSKSIKK